MLPLQYMESVYMTNCLLPNENFTTEYVNLLKALREFEENQGTCLQQTNSNELKFNDHSAQEIPKSLIYEEAKRGWFISLNA